jgi:amino acid transporter
MMDLKTFKLLAREFIIYQVGLGIFFTAGYLATLAMGPIGAFVVLVVYSGLERVGVIND